MDGAWFETPAMPVEGHCECRETMCSMKKHDKMHTNGNMNVG